MPRKRRNDDGAELDFAADHSVPTDTAETLLKLRSMWEFASLMQYIFLFGHVVKIDEDFDIEDLEAECLTPSPSEKLARIGLALLKYVSSHRGLTLDIFDEYARRQYTAKAPHRNPFGEEEEPVPFQNMDIFNRVRVLHQLSTWTFVNPDRIRSLMPEEEDQVNWRMDPVGWDKEDRVYFVLDDNRLYRRSDEPPPLPVAIPKAKARSLKHTRSGAIRTSKRRKIEDSTDEEREQTKAGSNSVDRAGMINGKHSSTDVEVGIGFTSETWECVAVNLDEYQEFLSTIFRSRDLNEKQLKSRIEEDVMPIIEKRAESLRQRQLKKMRELENLQKMALAKRSSRLAGKAEREKQDREEREAEEKHKAELEMARKEEERRRRIEEGHESRRLTREQRLREREAKRILHEEELAKLEEEEQIAQSREASIDLTTGSKRMSSRQLKTQREQHQKELEKLAVEEGKWTFDCVTCGLHGENLDDGTHSIACDRCNVWQHSKCHGFSPKQAEDPGFVFICGTCKRKEEYAKRPQMPLLKLSKGHVGNSHEPAARVGKPYHTTAQHSNGLSPHVGWQSDGASHSQQPHHPSPVTQGIQTSAIPPDKYAHELPSKARYPPVGNFAITQTQTTWPSNPTSTLKTEVPGHASISVPPARKLNGSSSTLQFDSQNFAHPTAVSSSNGPAEYDGQRRAYAMPDQPQRVYQFSPPHKSRSPPPQRFQQPSPHIPTDVAHSPSKPKQNSSQLVPDTHQGRNYEFPPQPTQQTFRFMQHTPKISTSPHAELSKQQLNHSSTKPDHHPYTFAPTAYQTSLTNDSHAQHVVAHEEESYSPIHSAAAIGIAAGGMSGPWPEGGQVIPQEQHQSSPQPSTAHSIGETRIVPPTTPLTPSPNHQSVVRTEIIPVKKTPQPCISQTSDEQTLN